jgi:ketosteroid isomerase-like protein
MAMSEENLAKARAFIDAYNRRDFDAAVEWFDPGVEWVLPERQSSDSCQGPGAIIRFWKGLDETFEELQLRPQEWLDFGDRVATRLRHYAHGKESGLVLDEELYHQVITFRDGWMVRLEYFASWPEALEAARTPVEVSRPASPDAPRPPAAGRRA